VSYRASIDIFIPNFFLVILLTILVSVAYHIVRDVCRESNRSKRYGPLACSTCVLPEPNPNVVDVEVGEGGFVKAAHSSVVEVINEDLNPYLKNMFETVLLNPGYLFDIITKHVFMFH
jgi:hypothetical protein